MKYGYIYLIEIPTSKGIFTYVGQKKGSTIVNNYYGSGVKIKDWFLKHTHKNSRHCSNKIAEQFNVKRRILAWCNSEEELIKAERFFISLYRNISNSWNISDGGKSGWTKESHLKSVLTRKKNGSYIMNEKQKQKLSKSNLGKKHTEETKRKISQKLSGCNNGMSKEKGGHTQEWREKHKKAMLGRKHDYCAKQVICLETGEIFRSCDEAAKHFGCSRTYISYICQQKILNGYRCQTIKGFHLKYYNKGDK